MRLEAPIIWQIKMGSLPTYAHCRCTSAAGACRAFCRRDPEQSPRHSRYRRTRCRLLARILLVCSGANDVFHRFSLPRRPPHKGPPFFWSIWPAYQNHRHEWAVHASTAALAAHLTKTRIRDGTYCTVASVALRSREIPQAARPILIAKAAPEDAVHEHAG
jgi:hypothetical protein